MIFNRSDAGFAFLGGALIALLSLVVLKNIQFFAILAAKGEKFVYLFIAYWLVAVPIITVLGLYCAYRVAQLRWPVIFELGKYGIIGWLNTFLYAGIFNVLVLVTGIAQGWWVDVFIVVSSVVTITQSFFWNKFWIFKAHHTDRARSEYVKYFSLTAAMAFFNAALLHVIINVIGAPFGFDLKIWANIALAIVIPVSVMGNFFGSKFFVFRKSAPPTTIEFVDLKRQYRTHKQEIGAAIQRVFNKSEFIFGEEVKNFEREFAEFCGVKHCITVASGTDALFLSLKALNIGSGDEVITAPNSFISTALCISMVGATPVFADVDPQTYNIDPQKIEEKITSKTRAIIPVHLFGQPADMDAIRDIAGRHHLKILEDACQAHGARYKGARVGGLGDIAAFSFYPSKNLGAYGDGGAIATNSDTLAEKVRLLRDFGRTQKDRFQIFGFNSRLDNLQAAILRVKLKCLDAWSDRRGKNAAFYTELLRGSGVKTPVISNDVESVFHLYVVRSQRRDGLIEYLRAKNIAALVHYPIPLHLQPVYKELGYKKGDFPVTESAADEIVSLPIFPELTEDEIRSIAHLVVEYHAN